MVESNKVQQFYDQYTDKMLRYRLYGNLRIEKAIELIENNVSANSKILDLGCGIGIVPEKISLKLEKGKILACDLGNRNIEYAKKTIDSNRIEFLNVDIVENFSLINSKLESQVDLVTMVDVIEHLPVDGYDSLFSNLSKITTDKGKLILTYPSPEYQHYLKENEQEKLQVIDEVIEIESLLALASKYGFALTYFSYVDVWRKNQYVHCILSKCVQSIPIEEKKLNTFERVKCRITDIYKSKVVFPQLRNKYIHKIGINAK